MRPSDNYFVLEPKKAAAVVDVLFPESPHKASLEEREFMGLLEMPLSYGWIYIMSETVPGVYLKNEVPAYNAMFTWY